ncbi:MAG: hypothetical protein V5A62_05190 [Haloarculaceae archaeon]
MRSADAGSNRRWGELHGTAHRAPAPVPWRRSDHGGDGHVSVFKFEGLDRSTRLAAAGALRAFLEACPDYGATLEQTTTAACCGGYTNPTEGPADVLFCPACDVRLFRFDTAGQDG